ncbi:MAG: hypothetical protein Q4D51_12930 [Eubacteriales bacterium]|nr:hypothetical protein [Eubacteriales bacterium]
MGPFDMFDLNRDGKVDDMEMTFGMDIIEEWEREEEDNDFDDDDNDDNDDW